MDTSEFINQYANLNKIQQNTRQDVNRVQQQRNSTAQDHSLNSRGFVKKHTDKYVKAAPKSSRSSIKERQRQLKDMGLYTGKIDGIWGDKSIAAHNAATANGLSWINGNYVVVGGPDTVYAGIGFSGNNGGRASTLSQTQFDNPKKRQKQLKELGFYDGKIDGNFGDKSKIAHQKALHSGYVYEDGEYKRSFLGTVGEYANRAKNLFRNGLDVGMGAMFGASPFERVLTHTGLMNQTPAGIMTSDIVNSTANKLARTILPDDFTVFGRPTVTSLPDDQMAVLRAHMNSLPDGRAPRSESQGWFGGDYRRVQGNYAQGDRAIERITTPEDMIANTLGQYSYRLDENGNVIISDIYDFNERKGDAHSRNTSGVYDWVREKAGEYGSRPDDPDRQKLHFEINLGNPRYNWRVIH